MAGRGTDIVLGGFPESETARKEIVELEDYMSSVPKDMNLEELITNLEEGQDGKVTQVLPNFSYPLMTACSRYLLLIE